MFRFYANENFPLPPVESLRQLGHDVLTTMESGKSGQAIPDSEVLEFATAESRILITLNRRHFIRLHSEKSRTTPESLSVCLTLTFLRWRNAYMRRWMLSPK
jgi:hypothetical protein